MAIVTTAVEAAPTPWSTRAPPSTAMVGARPLTIEATTWRSVPKYRGLRRP
jgi:hypothetical protein